MIVETASDGKVGLSHALNNDYMVVVLDLMLPLLDGISILKQMRAERVASPVLILSAKSQVSERVKGLELGADDYLIKPFSLEDFLSS